MLFAKLSKLFSRRLRLKLLAMVTLALCSGCTYSVDDQYAASHARSVNMDSQLEFSFHLERDQVSADQDIFFVAIFTNTLDQPLVFREPRQQSVMEEVYPDTVLFFSIESITTGRSVRYPMHSHPSRPLRIVRQDEFVILPPHGSCQTRLQLPNILEYGQQVPLPPGQYRVRMTYMNDDIGYEVELFDEMRWVDINSWAGQLEGSPITMTITSEK